METQNQNPEPPTHKPDALKPDQGPPLTPPESPAPRPAEPPAAAVVITGTKTEREADLEATLEKERQTRKAREMRLAELEDENRQLKNISRPEPVAIKQKSTWLDGCTFFGNN